MLKLVYKTPSRPQNLQMPSLDDAIFLYNNYVELAEQANWIINLLNVRDRVNLIIPKLNEKEQISKSIKHSIDEIRTAIQNIPSLKKATEEDRLLITEAPTINQCGFFAHYRYQCFDQASNTTIDVTLKVPWDANYPKFNLDTLEKVYMPFSATHEEYIHLLSLPRIYRYNAPNDKIAISQGQITEFINGGKTIDRELSRLIDQNPKHALDIIIQSGHSLHRLHQAGMAHLNLKKSNIVLTNNKLKITGIHFADEVDKNHHQATDYFAFGFILFEFLTDEYQRMQRLERNPKLLDSVRFQNILLREKLTMISKYSEKYQCSEEVVEKLIDVIMNLLFINHKDKDNDIKNILKILEKEVLPHLMGIIPQEIRQDNFSKTGSRNYIGSLVETMPFLASIVSFLPSTNK